jgi:hypothetical protein
MLADKHRPPDRAFSFPGLPFHPQAFEFLATLVFFAGFFTAPLLALSPTGLLTATLVLPLHYIS